jgi:ribose/xylose/arabinose/galactoside ABC-type transport system permease subunit
MTTTMPDAPPVAAPKRKSAKQLLTSDQPYVVFIALVALIVFFSIKSPYFFADGLELDVIAAVILGGTSLFGGRGTIVGTLIGSLIIGVLNNGLVIIGVNSSWQIAVKGAIIILAVAFSKRN